jgi:glycine hydroxymethyltransferase
MTTRGMGTTEFTEIANIIADRLLVPTDESVATSCRQRIAVLCERFPLYPHLSMPVPALV